MFTTETVVNPLGGTLLDVAAAIESIPTPGSDEAREDLEKLPRETRPGDAVGEVAAAGVGERRGRDCGCSGGGGIMTGERELREGEMVESEAIG